MRASTYCYFREGPKIAKKYWNSISPVFFEKIESPTAVWSYEASLLLVDFLRTLLGDGGRKNSDTVLPLAKKFFDKLISEFTKSEDGTTLDSENKSPSKKRKARKDLEGPPQKHSKGEDGKEREAPKQIFGRYGFQRLGLETAEKIITQLLRIEILAKNLRENSAENFGKNFVQTSYSIPKLRIILRMLEARAISPESLHHFFLTHPQLLPMLMNDSKKPGSEQTSVISGNSVFLIVSVFFKIYEQNSALCSPKLLPFLFSLYSARTNFFDRLLLAVFFLYDRAGVDILECTGYLWGNHGKVFTLF
jgi:hypothetical protein